MKDKLGGKLEFLVLRPKAYSYLIDDDDEIKKATSTKNCDITQNLKFNYFKNYLEANQLENETNLPEKIMLK